MCLISGGDDILEEVLGQDASEPFREIGHSEDAKRILEELLVGKLCEDAVVSNASHLIIKFK